MRLHFPISRRLVLRVALGCLLVPPLLDLWLTFSARDAIYDRERRPPQTQVGLVLGTAKYVGRRINRY